MGWVEIFIIVIVALMVIGPDKLPEVARGLAKGLRQVQRLVGEVRDTINLDEFDRQVRQEIDNNLSPNNMLNTETSSKDSPHRDFKDYNEDIDDDEDPYAPMPNPKAAEKKVTGDS